MTRPILIYRDQLLPYSETFIQTQVDSLQQYQGIYVGTSRLGQGQISIPPERSLCLSDGVAHAGVWKTALKLGGIIHPGWLRRVRATSALLVHAHFGLDALWAARLARQLHLPLMITFRGSDITGMQFSRPNRRAPRPLDFIHHRGQFYRDFYLQRRPALFQEAKICIGVSGFICDRMIQAGCPEQKAVVVYNGIDLAKFTARPDCSRQPVVLFVGRLVEKKGCEYLLPAVAKLQATCPEATLVVIGDGPRRTALEQRAQQLLSSYRFLGAQPHSVVRDWMNRATVLAAPSITASTGDSEGLPNVVVEAQAMGLPVVGFIHAGIPEAVVEGKTGFLVPEKAVEALADRLLTLFSQPGLWQQFSGAARQHVEQNFDLKRSIEKLEGLYTQVIEEGSRV
ncbi:glycosyltransferase [Pseudanabaena sp. FACHB-2040]|uniref:glycosyltransferase n=1 Tax=Pseudanabaena sp. FACHB-2040 TaxID=2692859 RepID=UPI0016894155|nr:glycosyltransferase [Pseudanabaena sp. FACHB-2040]MBD2258630.1 glycosyltransferase [Pseudanabaena sp. FACHB-2040]